MKDIRDGLAGNVIIPNNRPNNDDHNDDNNDDNNDDMPGLETEEEAAKRIADFYEQTKAKQVKQMI